MTATEASTSTSASKEQGAEDRASNLVRWLELRQTGAVIDDDASVGAQANILQLIRNAAAESKADASVASELMLMLPHRQELLLLISIDLIRGKRILSARKTKTTAAAAKISLSSKQMQRSSSLSLALFLWVQSGQQKPRHGLQIILSSQTVQPKRKIGFKIKIKTISFFSIDRSYQRKKKTIILPLFTSEKLETLKT